MPRRTRTEAKQTPQEKKDDLRVKLRATIEANRVSRLGWEEAEEYLKTVENKLESAKGHHKKYLEVLVVVLNNKLDEKAEAAANQSLGGEIGAGGSFDSGGCAGSD